jgi:two-component system sensor histidine kinase BarA
MYAPKPAIDWQECLSLASNKEHLAKQILGMYIQSLPKIKDNLIAHRNDFNKLEDEVHQLVGASCYCGVPKIKEAANDLERSLKSDNKKQADLLVDIISVYIDEVLEVYEEGSYLNPSDS